MRAALELVAAVGTLLLLMVAVLVTGMVVGALAGIDMTAVPR